MSLSKKNRRKPLYTAPIPIKTIANEKLVVLERMLLDSRVLDELHKDLLTDHVQSVQRFHNRSNDSTDSIKQNRSAIGSIWLSNQSIAPPQTVTPKSIYYLKNTETKQNVNATKAREYLNEIRSATYQDRFSRQCSRLFFPNVS